MGIGRRIVTVLKVVAWAIAALVVALVTIVIIFVVLVQIEQSRMDGKANAVRAWIAAEIPAGSTVPHTVHVLESHDVTGS